MGFFSLRTSSSPRGVRTRSHSRSHSRGRLRDTAAPAVPWLQDTVASARPQCLIRGCARLAAGLAAAPPAPPLAASSAHRRYASLLLASCFLLLLPKRTDFDLHRRPRDALISRRLVAAGELSCGRPCVPASKTAARLSVPARAVSYRHRLLLS